MTNIQELFAKKLALYTVQAHSYLRWLMLIATGAFSLSVNVLFGKNFYPVSVLVMKAALSANAIGILCGAIAVSGEAKLTKMAIDRLVDIETHILKGNNIDAANVSTYVFLPSYMRKIEQLCYISLCASLCFWICFIWLQ